MALLRVAPERHKNQFNYVILSSERRCRKGQLNTHFNIKLAECRSSRHGGDSLRINRKVPQLQQDDFLLAPPKSFWVREFRVEEKHGSDWAAGSCITHRQLGLFLSLSRKDMRRCFSAVLWLMQERTTNFYGFRTWSDVYRFGTTRTVHKKAFVRMCFPMGVV